MESALHDLSRNPLYQLLADVQDLIQYVHKHGSLRIHRQITSEQDQTLNKSVVNLAQYLALRERDLRPLQERLAEAGLSSLGRAEPHVFANLKNVADMLSRALGNPSHIRTELPYPAFREGFQILERNTEQILGRPSHARSTRVMVTLPSEAANDYALVHKLIQEGMDVARINCAHDDELAWQKMLNHIRRAARELNLTCRVLMDLAGHKIRTGPIHNNSEAFTLKAHKDFAGRTHKPVRFRIVAAGPQHDAHAEQDTDVFVLPVPEHVHAGLAEGDRFSLIDARGKRRMIAIALASGQDEFHGECMKTIALNTNTRMAWQRFKDKKWRDLHSFQLSELPITSGVIHLQVGDELVLHKSLAVGHGASYSPEGDLLAPAQLACSVPQVIDRLEPGAPVWLDDGKISAYVSSKTDECAVLRITKTAPGGAKLKADKGLNLPETRLNLPALTDKDKRDLDFVCAHADMVGFSFIETADDMRELIRALQARNAAHMPIIAKIETAQAVKNLPDILFTAILSNPLGVMIARGDLAVELGSVRMAEIQEEILWLCEAAHVPVIWATQVLESIAKHGVRSRPEFTDAAMGVRAECVMLNKGPYILEAMRSLNAVLQRMQDHQRKKISRLRALHW